MSTIRRTLLRLCLLGISVGFLSCAVMAAEPRDPRLEKILANWQERQHWFQTIKYKVVGVHKVPKGAYNEVMEDYPGFRKAEEMSPLQDVEFPIGFTFLLDLAKERYNYENLEYGFDMGKRRFLPLRKKDVFNGSVMKCLISKEENPDHKDIGETTPEMSILSGNMKSGQYLLNMSLFAVFFAHGRIYTAMQPILPGKFRNDPDPDYFYIHGTGVYEDRPCLIVRTQTLKQSKTSFAEYWVDTARENAIVRFVSYSGKNISGSIDLHYSRSHGHWLPESWRYNSFNYGKSFHKTLYYYEMRVLEITIDPAVTEADFELEVKPGMLVQEGKSLPTHSPLEWPKQEVSVYRVKDNGDLEDIPDPHRRPGDQYPSHRPRRLVWVWGVAFVMVVSFGIFWKRYRRLAGH